MVVSIRDLFEKKFEVVSSIQSAASEIATLVKLYCVIGCSETGAFNFSLYCCCCEQLRYSSEEFVVLTVVPKFVVAWRSLWSIMIESKKLDMSCPIIAI